MLPATTHPTLPLKLVSLEIVKNGQDSPLTPSLQQESLNHQLQIIPGRRSELLLWLENTGEQPIRWHLELGGDLGNQFPLAWCHWEQKQDIIAPHSKLSQIVAFEPPATFFEKDNLKMQQLQLAYQGSVAIFAHLDPVVSNQEAAGTLVGYKNVDLRIQPGSTYLDFLPEIYRSDFMERFIAIFEQAFDPTVQTTDSLWAYLDPLTAPKSLIPFLARWVDWPLNPNWTLKRQRKLIKHAVELYRWRGTKQGLQLMLHLHTELPIAPLNSADESPIEIKESFESGFVLGQSVLKDSPRLGGGKPYFFEVVLRPPTVADAIEINEALIRSVIEQEKPAFCSYQLSIIPPDMNP